MEAVQNMETSQNIKMIKSGGVIWVRRVKDDGK
jgi:hypothetical protein